MVSTHPYISGPRNVAEMIIHLRKTFPAVVNSETVKKLGLASNNESFVINALQFIGIIDEEGKKTKRGAEVFSLSGDEFAVEFKKLLESSYSDLASLHGEDMWKLTRDQLSNYFRKTDQTSDVIGGRQAGLFQTLATFAGYGEVDSKPKTKRNSNGGKPAIVKANKAVTPESEPKRAEHLHRKSDVAMTVRIEINLPSGGTKETYDHIFQSIRENLLND